MAVRGFNIFAIGANGAHIQGSVRALLEDAAAKRPKPSDWVYVNNFATPHRPVAIALPPGRAPALDKALDRLIDDLKVVAARGVRKRGLPEAPQRHRAGDPRSQRARLHRGARQGDGEGHRDPAHADGLRHGADEGRPGGAARRLQRLAGGTPARGADGDRGAGKGPGRDAARGCRGWSANSATRCVRWIATPRASRLRSRSRSARRSSPTCRRSCSTWKRSRPTSWRTSRCSSRRRRPAKSERRARPAALFDRYEVNVFVTTADGEAGAPGRRGGASDAEQPGRPHRASRGAGRAGDQLPADQAGQPASRQWRRADDRSAQPADRAAELGGAEARPAAPGDRHRGRRAVHGHDHDGHAGTGSDPARREGRAVRRPHAVLPAGLGRSGHRAALQGARRLRRRRRSLAGERGDDRAADRLDRGECRPAAARSRRRGAGDRARGAAGRRCRQAHAAGRKHPRPGGGGVALLRRRQGATW